MIIKKKALITGITGQDGSYLAQFLLKKGYEVHGLRRRVSVQNIERIEHLISEPQETSNDFYLHYGDMTDTSSVLRIIQQTQPDEIYNLAAQSHVHTSFDSPEYTANADGIGSLRILESIRILQLEKKTKYYQASTSELFGQIQEPIQTEQTPFYPRSPYAVAKLYAYWITVNYREAYGLYACNGILFNHESPVRGDTFVTRKITIGLARITLGLQQSLYMGNIDAERDWGHARDYVRMQWMMLQQDKPEDFVIASGVKRSVRTFIEYAADFIGIKLEWHGKGLDEVGLISSIDIDRYMLKIGEKPTNIFVGKPIIKIDKYYYRPTEVDTLLGDASRAKEKLGWSPEITFDEMVSDMMTEDIYLAKSEIESTSPGKRVIYYK
jgi:GDPmannose 4,6-dehydratase